MEIANLVVDRNFSQKNFWNKRYKKFGAFGGGGMGDDGENEVNKIKKAYTGFLKENFPVKFDSVFYLGCGAGRLI